MAAAVGEFVSEIYQVTYVVLFEEIYAWFVTVAAVVVVGCNESTID